MTCRLIPRRETSVASLSEKMLWFPFSQTNIMIITIGRSWKSLTINFHIMPAACLCLFNRGSMRPRDGRKLSSFIISLPIFTRPVFLLGLLFHSAHFFAEPNTDQLIMYFSFVLLSLFHSTQLEREAIMISEIKPCININIPLPLPLPTWICFSFFISLCAVHLFLHSAWVFFLTVPNLKVEAFSVVIFYLTQSFDWAKSLLSISLQVFGEGQWKTTIMCVRQKALNLNQ